MDACVLFYFPKFSLSCNDGQGRVNVMTSYQLSVNSALPLTAARVHHV